MTKLQSKKASCVRIPLVPGLAGLLFVLLCLCRHSVSVAMLLPRSPFVASSHAFQAGAARIDITPPPGLATGGHGPAGAIARGHLTRLYARAFYFRDTDDHSLLLISVETFAVPQVFRKEIQKQVQSNVRERFKDE